MHPSCHVLSFYELHQAVCRERKVPKRATKHMLQFQCLCALCKVHPPAYMPTATALCHLHIDMAAEATMHLQLDCTADVQFVLHGLHGGKLEVYWYISIAAINWVVLHSSV